MTGRQFLIERVSKNMSCRFPLMIFWIVIEIFIYIIHFHLMPYAIMLFCQHLNLKWLLSESGAIVL